MNMVQLFLVWGGISLMLLILYFAFSGPSTGKAQTRRLDTIRERHIEGANAIVESQLRKIAANRNKASSMDNLAQRLLPNPAQFRLRLDQTGKNWSSGQYLTTCLLIAAAIAVVGIWAGAPFLMSVLGGLAIGLALPHLVVGSLISKRGNAFIAKFPDAIELMVRGLRAGLPISETLHVVASEVPGPVGVEFRGVTDRIRIGKTMDVALLETAERMNIAEVNFFCITLAIQRETGGNLAETLSNLAEVLRKRSQMKLKIRAMSSESKASAYIIGALPFLVFMLLMYISPAYMGDFFKDQRLMGLGLGGMVWMGLGAFVMSKMISFEI